jgi:hypothetical protein
LALRSLLVALCNELRQLRVEVAILDVVIEQVFRTRNEIAKFRRPVAATPAPIQPGGVSQRSRRGPGSRDGFEQWLRDEHRRRAPSLDECEMSDKWISFAIACTQFLVQNL